jgi:hypothetical protein
MGLTCKKEGPRLAPDLDFYSHQTTSAICCGLINMLSLFFLQMLKEKKNKTAAAKKYIC